MFYRATRSHISHDIKIELMGIMEKYGIKVLMKNQEVLFRGRVEDS